MRLRIEMVLFFDVLIADNDHVRHLFELCFANLGNQSSRCGRRPRSGSPVFKLLLDFIEIVEVAVCDGQQLHLHRASHNGNAPAYFFDEQREGTLVAADGVR